MKTIGRRSESINFNSIAAMMCGETLTEDQKKDVLEMKKQYNAAKERKNRKNTL